MFHKRDKMDRTRKLFYITDLKDEFDYIHDSIYLELDYMNHIVGYLLQFNQRAA